MDRVYADAGSIPCLGRRFNSRFFLGLKSKRHDLDTMHLKLLQLQWETRVQFPPPPPISCFKTLSVNKV